MTLNAAAARTITAHARNDADALAFMLMLGIVGDDGELLPDDTRSVPIQLTDIAAGSGLKRNLEADPKVRPRVSTAPDGLRNLAPVVVAVKPVKAKAVKAAPKPRVRRRRPSPTGQTKNAVAKCGTRAGYQRHSRVLNEPACEPCKKANAASQRRHKKSAAERAASPLRSSAECGTPAGYHTHRRRNEQTCVDCKAAMADDRRRREHANRAASGMPILPRATAECGTLSGRNAHYRRGEKPCEECRAASNTWERLRYAERRNRKPAAQSEAA